MQDDSDSDDDSGLDDTPSFSSSVPAPIDDENDLLAYVAQCEAVLGPIPEIDCDPEHPAPGTTVTKIPVFHEGRLIGFDGDDDPEGVLADRKSQGRYQCDFPSMGGDFPCAVGSTLVHHRNPENPNVQWVSLCRGPRHDNPGYDRFVGNGLIGANDETGEMCFFFGTNPHVDEPYELPHLSRDAESTEALRPWLPPADMPGSCLSCHPNNDPWVLTPWLGPTYLRTTLEDPDYPLQLPDGVEIEDVLAARFVSPSPHRAQLPDPLPADRTAWTEEEIFDDGTLVHRQYRAIGSSYVAAEAYGEVARRTAPRPRSWDVDFRDRLRLVADADSCASGCHALANEHFGTLAIDALGGAPASLYGPDAMENNVMPQLTWMPPRGVEIQDDTVPAGSIRAITECPIPKRIHVEPEVTVECAESGRVRARVTVDWTYRNDFGDVPGRDDVRFDVAFGDANRLDTRMGRADDDVEGRAFRERDHVSILHDVATEDLEDGQYTVTVPVDETIDEFVVLVQPKRYCFEEPDRRPFSFAVPEVIEIDVNEACER